MVGTGAEVVRLLRGARSRVERPGEAPGRGRPREGDRDLGRSLEPGGLAPVEKERKRQ